MALLLGVVVVVVVVMPGLVGVVVTIGHHEVPVQLGPEGAPDHLPGWPAGPAGDWQTGPKKNLSNIALSRWA